MRISVFAQTRPTQATRKQDTWEVRQCEYEKSGNDLPGIASQFATQNLGFVMQFYDLPGIVSQFATWNVGFVMQFFRFTWYRITVGLCHAILQLCRQTSYEAHGRC